MNGDSGLPGSDGVKGDRGFDGVDGQKGEKGVRGIAGPTVCIYIQWSLKSSGVVFTDDMNIGRVHEATPELQDWQA